MNVTLARVQGSSDEPYTIVIAHGPGQLHMNCTCQAGQLAKICKHRLAILNGDLSAVVAGAEALQALPTLLRETEAQRALDALMQAEATLEQAKQAVTLAKRIISRKLQIPDTQGVYLIDGELTGDPLM